MPPRFFQESEGDHEIPQDRVPAVHKPVPRQARPGEGLLQARLLPGPVAVIGSRSRIPESVPEANADFEAGRAPGVPSKIGADRHEAGSVAQAVALYTGSAEFANGLEPSTRRTRFLILRHIATQFGSAPIRKLARADIEAWLEAETPGSARGLLQALRPFTAFCVSKGLLKADPSAGIKAPKQRNQEIHTMTPAQLKQFRDDWPLDSMARRTLELAFSTGARRSDLVKLGWFHVHGDVIRFVPQKTAKKTGIEVENDILPELACILETLPKTDKPFLISVTGKPFTPNALSNWFRIWSDKAGLPKCCSLHGVRKAGATEMAERDGTEYEVMSFLGHASPKEGAVYTRKVDRRRLSRSGQAKRRTLIDEPVAPVSQSTRIGH